MSDYLPEILQFNISFIFVVLILAVSALISYILYRETNPENSDIVKIALGTLRTFLLLLIIILFFKPKLFYQFIEDKPRDILLLIDHSASMGWKSEVENRQDETRWVVSQIEENIQDYDVNLSKKYFNSSVLESSDSLNEPFGATNFLSVLDYISDNNTDQVILVSDGIRTMGRIPAINRHVPIYTVGIGKVKNDPDVFITDVQFKPVVYQGKEQLIKVVVSAKNVNNAGITASLISGNTVLTSSTFIFEKSGTEQEVILKTTPLKPGLMNFKVMINSSGEDLNKQNNKFVFSQEVVKSKIRIGIFTSVPNNEFKFLKLLLSGSDDIEVHSYLKILNKAVEQPYPTDSLDVIIMQGYPASATDGKDINQIVASLEKHNQGLIVFLDEQTDIYRLTSFNKYLPIENISKRNKPAITTVFPENSNNMILQLYEDNAEKTAFFQAVPPVKVMYSVSGLKKSSEALIRLAGNENEKCLIVNDEQSSKSILYNGSGFWKWHFSLFNNSLYKDGYEKMLMNQVRWLSGTSKFKPVVLEINKKSINPGQEIVLDGYLFDAQSKAITNGSLLVEARVGEHTFSINLVADSTGKYSKHYTPISEGRYHFTGKGFYQDIEVGQDVKVLDVVPYNREFIQTNQDTAFLKLMAEQSAAAYFRNGEVENLLSQMDLKPQKVRIEEEIELRHKAWLMYLILAFAVTEWTFRKIKNLA